MKKLNEQQKAEIQAKNYYDEVECPYCEKVMEEEWQSFCDADDNEAEGMVGYKCEKCGARFDMNGEEI